MNSIGSTASLNRFLLLSLLLYWMANDNIGAPLPPTPYLPSVFDNKKFQFFLLTHILISNYFFMITIRHPHNRSNTSKQSTSPQRETNEVSPNDDTVLKTQLKIELYI